MKRRYPELTASFDSSSEEKAPPSHTSLGSSSDDEEVIILKERKLSPPVHEVVEEEDSDEVIIMGTKKPTIEDTLAAVALALTPAILSATQQTALDLIRSGENIFITGNAGSGKSFLVDHIQKDLNERGIPFVVCAATGSAAFQIHGITLHSFAGVGRGVGKVEYMIKTLQKNKLKKAEWEEIEVLIIDEISLLNTIYLEKLNTIAQQLRRCRLPFGGIQLILVGDYCQCPPIYNKEDQAEMKDRYLFQSTLWKKLAIRCVRLTQNFRQAKDQAFRGLLEHMRVAKLTEDDKKLLESRLLSRHGNVDPHTLIKLCSYKAQAEKINREQLSKIDSGVRVFEGKFAFYYASGQEIVNEGEVAKRVEKMASAVSVPPQLQLKEGALVMLCGCNLDVKGGLFNGSRGTVIGFETNGDPIVEFEEGGTVTVKPHVWKTFNGKKLEASYTQVPLLLRYAITIHKAQGLTLDKVLIEMDFWETGLGYVAFSRARSLAGVYISRLNTAAVKADQVVIDFYQNNKM